MNMSDYDYLRAIWHQFYGPVASDPAANEQHHHLSQKLDPDLRKELLRLVDCYTCHTERVSLESFIAGFQVATGIAKELAGKWYSFEKDEERQIRHVP